MNTILIAVSAVVLVGAVIIIRNLLSKVEKYEEIISTNDTYITKISEAIDIAQSRLKEIDVKGTFKSDDEIGWFFKNLSYIQEILNEFNLKNDRTKEESNKKQ